MAIDERADLTLDDFPQLRASGTKWRAGCPVHGSDHQRSVRINPQSGHWKCHVADCGAWGYIAELKQDQPTIRLRGKVQPPPKPPRPYVSPERRQEIADALGRAQATFAGSPAEAYLEERGIPPALAQQYGAGFADWDKWPRVIFPLYDPDGLVALYGRAIGDAPKGERHRITDGAKGYFNLPNVIDAPEVTLAEGVFDALSVIAAGDPNVVAIVGADDFRPDWLRRQKVLTFALDNDSAGQAAMDKAAPIARCWGFQVAIVDGEAYGEHKDLNAYWIANQMLPWGTELTATEPEPDDYPLPDSPDWDGWIAGDGGIEEDARDYEEQIRRDLFDDDAQSHWQPKMITFHRPTWVERCAAHGIDTSQWRERIDAPSIPGDPHVEALELQSLWRDLGEPPVYGPWGGAISDLVRWMRLNGPENWESIRWSLSIWDKQRDRLKRPGALAG